MAENRFSSTALGAIRLAQSNAVRLGHSYVGSEHLLLGLASQEYSPAGRILSEHGLSSSVLRSSIIRHIGSGTPTCVLHQGLTPHCCQAIRRAASESRRTGPGTVSSEHLLLGLLQKCPLSGQQRRKQMLDQ